MFQKLGVLLLILSIAIVKIFSNPIETEDNSKNTKAPVYTSCLKPGQFVLTFDDGPNPDTTPIALETLKKYDIKATFFINGVNYSNLETDQRAVDMVKTTYAEGHDIGSHTYYHEDLFDALKNDTLEVNIDKLTETIDSIIGVKPAFFRPPLGHGGHDEEDPEKQAMTDKIQTFLGSRGYNIIMWGTDTRDWEYGDDIQKVTNELNIQLTAPGVSSETHSFITLLHDIHPKTVNTVLPAVIEYVKKLGYTIVPLSECIGISPYQGVSLDKSNNLNSTSVDKEMKSNAFNHYPQFSILFTILSLIIVLFHF